MRILICCIIFLTTLNCQEKKSIKIEKDDFSMTYPSYLELDEKSIQPDVVLAIKTKEDGDNDIFIENINLSKIDIKNISYENLIQGTINDINSVGNLIESKSSLINGNQYNRIIFTLTQNDVKLKFIQDYYLKGRTVYVLTFSSEEKEYNRYYDEMNEIMLSFKFK